MVTIMAFTRNYLILGTAVIAANVVYNYNVTERISNVESKILDIHNDVTEIKEAVLEQKPVNVKFNEKDIECLARNIYWEAGVEPMVGKIAVGTVTLNRVLSNRWGRNICDVVYSKAQFSWTKERKRSWINLKGRAWADSKAAAEAVVNGIKVKKLNKALFYHADYVNPIWQDNSKRITKIGRHIFYTQAKGNNTKL